VLIRGGRADAHDDRALGSNTASIGALQCTQPCAADTPLAPEAVSLTPPPFED